MMENLITLGIGLGTIAVNAMMIRANRQGAQATTAIASRQQSETEKNGTYDRLERDLARLEKRAEVAEARAAAAEKRADRADEKIDKIAISLAAHGQWDLLVLAEVRKTAPDFPEPPVVLVDP